MWVADGRDPTSPLPARPCMGGCLGHAAERSPLGCWPRVRLQAMPALLTGTVVRRPGQPKSGSGIVLLASSKGLRGRFRGSLSGGYLVRCLWADCGKAAARSRHRRSEMVADPPETRFRALIPLQRGRYCLTSSVYNNPRDELSFDRVERGPPMAEVVNGHTDDSSSAEKEFDTALTAGITDGTPDDLGESRRETADIQSRPLSDEERRALLERERERMADPAYRRTLEDPTGVIEALLRHHGRPSLG